MSAESGAPPAWLGRHGEVAAAAEGVARLGAGRRDRSAAARTRSARGTPPTTRAQSAMPRFLAFRHDGDQIERLEQDAVSARGVI